MKQSQSTEQTPGNQDSREVFPSDLLSSINEEEKKLKSDKSEENGNIPAQSVDEEKVAVPDSPKESSPDNSVSKETKGDKYVDKEAREDSSPNKKQTLETETKTDNSIVKTETISDTLALNIEVITDDTIVNKETGADNSIKSPTDQAAVVRTLSGSRSGVYQSDGRTSQQSGRNSAKGKKTKESEENTSEVNKETKDSEKRTSDSKESKPKKEKPEIPPKPKRSSKDENKNSLSKTDFSTTCGVEEHNVIEMCADVDLITSAQMGLKRKLSDCHSSPIPGDRNVIHTPHLMIETGIPQQNQVITSVEIHREKTLSPQSIFSLSEQTGRPMSRELTRQLSNSSRETQL